MSHKLEILIDDDIAAALDRVIADTKNNFPRELVANSILRDWLVSGGYLPSSELDEDTPTQGQA